ncbi:MAG: TonB-dependent receptor [Woeseiaceae bacterium]|nr:TonB-dependent receptor [Woeseiaceae bacterium]
MKLKPTAVCMTALLVSVLSVPSEPVFAQGTNEAIEEIIVTSRKLGAENLREIPAAITAIDAQMLEDQMVVDFDDFARYVPGLTFLDTSPGEKRYVVRGIQSAGQQQVAVYYDEVPLPGVQSASSNSGSQTTDLKLYDMERVEVLRGPQGTVFGANSQGGTVRFITRQPTLGAFEGYASAELSRTTPSNDNNANFQAAVNLPMGETFAARVLVYDGEDAGYLDNTRCRATDPSQDPRVPGTNLSCLQLHDFNWVQTTGFRTNLLWEASDRMSFKGQIWWQDRDTGGDNRYHPFDGYNPSPTDPVYAGNADSVAAFTFFEEGKFRVGDYAVTSKPDEQTIYSLTGEFDVGFADLTATASRYERDFEFKFDSTWIITFLLQDNIGNAPCVGDPMVDAADCLRADLLYALTDQRQSLEQDAFEFRFNSKESDSPIKWVVGGFWRERSSEFQSFVPVIDTNGLTFSPPNPPTLPPTNDIGAGIPGCHPCVFARTDNKDIEERAIFGEINWEISDAFDVNFGIRWFDVDQLEEGFTNFQFAAFAPNPPDPTTPTGATPPSFNKLDDSEVPWKLAVAWHPSDETTVYALRANGFRLGGTNNRGIGAILIPESFESDELTNYEAGVKTLFGQGRTALNATVFLMEWENLQVSGRDLTGAFGFIGNAGSAEVQGIEVDVGTALTDNFYVTGQVTYLSKKELTEDQVSTEIVAPGLAGDEIPRVPELTAAVTAQYTYDLPITNWVGAFRIEGSYTGDSFTSLRPDDGENRYQDSYSIWNARANFRNDLMDLDVTVFIENIFDEDGDVFIGGGSGGQPTNKITNRPQTVGVQVTKGWGRN